MAMPSVAQVEIESVNKLVNKREVQSHIEFLASDELRGRKTGSSEIDIAAKYLSTQLSAYGAEPVEGLYFQSVKFNQVTRPTGLQIKLGDQSLEDLILLDGGNKTYEGRIVYLEFGNQGDFSSADVAGKLVIVKAGLSEPVDPRAAFFAMKQKRAWAIEKGAIGLVEVLVIPQMMRDQLKHFLDKDVRVSLQNEEKSDFVHIWALESAPLEMKKGKGVKGSLTVEGAEESEFVSKNVLAKIQGSDENLKNEHIVFTAHYDHVGVGIPNAEGDSIFNGARDNAVGVATVLTAAKYFGQNKPKRSVLFVLFTGEEEGILGSQWFVEHSPLPLSQMVYCLNSDNAGYTDKTAATIIGMERTTAKDLIQTGIEEAELSVIADPMKEQGLYERSDNVHFARVGIPAANISMGISSFDPSIQRVYHNVSDNPETLDYDYLTEYTKAYVNVARKIANARQTPYWSEGDPYSEAGNALYEK